jgi:hypothetical protein
MSFITGVVCAVCFGAFFLVSLPGAGRASDGAAYTLTQPARSVATTSTALECPNMKVCSGGGNEWCCPLYRSCGPKNGDCFDTQRGPAN